MTGKEPTGADAATRAAYASWSALTEPGDAEASLLVAVWGPCDALDWVRHGCEDLAGAAARLHGLVGREEAIRLVNAHERWARRLDLADAPWEQRAARVGARLVVPGDGEWPEVFDSEGLIAPHALWVRGQGHLGDLLSRGIGVVGARACTPYGDYVAAGISAGAADAGWTVVSGGAYGIDGAAHRAALAAHGSTVAVMAGGVDRLYPAGHDRLLRAVMDSGCVFSEVPVGSAPHRSRFLQRNRLIAAAAATVVVEAGRRSGALNTARHAAALLRPVGAVPGPVESASSAGCHALIREGVAVLVTCADDVIELAGAIGQARDGRSPLVADPWSAQSDGGAAARLMNFDSPAHRAVYDVLTARPKAIEHVAQAAGLAVAQARAALGGLVLDGLAHQSGIGWCRTPASASKSIRFARKSR